MSWIHMQMSKTCIMLRPFFNVSKMQYLFLKIYKFLEVLVCIQNLKFAYKFQFWIITHWEIYILMSLIVTLIQGP
jgi:hypothetical protein